MRVNLDDSWLIEELVQIIRERQHLDGESNSISLVKSLTTSTDDPIMKSVHSMIDTITSSIIYEKQGDLRDSEIKILENMTTFDREISLLLSNQLLKYFPDTLKGRIVTKLSSSVEAGLNGLEPEVQMCALACLKTILKSNGTCS
jgi:hypothetical protein